MASSINAITTGSGGVVTTADNSGNLNIQSGGTTVVAVTSAGAAVTGTLSASGESVLTGNIGVGVSPSAWNNGKAVEVSYVGNALFAKSSVDTFLTSGTYQTNNVWYRADTNIPAFYNIYNGTHIWKTGVTGGTANASYTPTTAMTLDASGNLIVGGSTSYGQITSVNSTAVANLIGLLDSGTTYGSSSYYMILRNSAGTVSGGIQHTASTTVNYATTSDERLKEDKGIATDTSVIDNIIIHDFKWIEDNRLDRGVFAQEAYEIKPSAVGVGSDEVTESGALENPWSVDYSKFVPDLIVHAQQLKKQVQEQQALIESLTTRLTALENK